MDIKCDKCKEKFANHRFGDGRHLCCECYVKEGNPPADWHPVCMETYRKLQQDDEPLST